MTRGTDRASINGPAGELQTPSPPPQQRLPCPLGSPFPLAGFILLKSVSLLFKGLFPETLPGPGSVQDFAGILVFLLVSGQAGNIRRAVGAVSQRCWLCLGGVALSHPLGKDTVIPWLWDVYSLLNLALFSWSDSGGISGSRCLTFF